MMVGRDYLVCDGNHIAAAIFVQVHLQAAGGLAPARIPLIKQLYRFAELIESLCRTLTSTRPPLPCFAAFPTVCPEALPILIAEMR